MVQQLICQSNRALLAKIDRWTGTPQLRDGSINLTETVSSCKQQQQKIQKQTKYFR